MRTITSYSFSVAVTGSPTRWPRKWSLTIEATGPANPQRPRPTVPSSSVTRHAHCFQPGLALVRAPR